MDIALIIRIRKEKRKNVLEEFLYRIFTKSRSRIKTSISSSNKSKNNVYRYCCSEAWQVILMKRAPEIFITTLFLILMDDVAPVIHQSPRSIPLPEYFNYTNLYNIH